MNWKQNPWSSAVRILCGAVVAGLLLTACGQVWTPEPAQPTATRTRQPTRAPATLAPTWTPLPIVPLPTYTPQATPTPIIYVIQGGDTLIGVAKRYGVSAQFLQTVNGILDPRRLQIGQELLIPAEEPGQEPAMPTSTPVPLVVGNAAIYQTQSGSYWLLGMVTNENSEPVERVAIEGDLLDRNERSLALAWGYTARSVIPAGESSAFAVFFRTVDGLVQKYQVRTISADTAGYLGHFYLDLQVLSYDSRSVTTESVEVSGVVQNVGDAIAECYVVVAAHDAAGRVAAVREAPADPLVLGPGEQGSFTALMVSLGEPIVSVDVAAQGERLGD